MHASCSICGDIFTGIDQEVLHSTTCGHIFHDNCLQEWLKRAKTCPHCRARVEEKKTFRLYFQLSNYSGEDSGSLQNEVQSLKFHLSTKEIDLKNKTEEVKKAKDQANALIALVKERETELRTHETVVSRLQDQMNVYKLQIKNLRGAQLQVEELEKKLKGYETVETILKGSVSDAADALDHMKDVFDPTTLHSCIVALKKELTQHKGKCKDLQNLLRSKETKLTSAVTEISNLENRISILNRSLSKVKEDLEYTEKENESLKKKCKNLEEAIIPTGSESNTSNPRDKALKRFINEYPSPNLKKNNASCIDLDVTLPEGSTKLETGVSPISPTRLHQQLKPRTLLNARRMAAPISSTSNVQCFDGLGGHAAEEFTRTDRSVLKEEIARSKTNRILPAKRMKSGTSTSKQKSNILTFTKKM